MSWSDAHLAAVTHWRGPGEEGMTAIETMMAVEGAPGSTWRAVLRVGYPPRDDAAPLTREQALLIKEVWDAEMTARDGEDHGRDAVLWP